MTTDKLTLDVGRLPDGTGLSQQAAEPEVSALRASIPSASWQTYKWDSRPVDLSERGAGYVEGFAAACASMSYALCHYPDAGKSYDPMSVELERATMHSYVFNMKDGGRHHPMSAYQTFSEIAECLFAETLEAIADEADICCRALRRIASAIEARRAETHSGSVHESAVAKPDAQGGSHDNP